MRLLFPIAAGRRPSGLRLAAPCAVLAAAFLVSIGTLRNDPVFDDHLILAGNADLIAGETPLHQAFARRYWGSAPESASNEIYRPLTIASLAIQARVLGSSPAGLHAGNILLHALNALLVWLLAVRLFRNRTLALLGGLLFAVHPLGTEAVAPLSGRADLLAAFFLLAASALALTAARHAGPSARVAAILAAISAACGVLSKEHVITAPLILALLIACDPFGRKDRALTHRYAPAVFAAVAVATAVAGRVSVLGYLWRSPLPDAPAAVQEALVGNPLLAAGAVARLFTVGEIVLRMLRLLWLPVTQSADYCYDQIPVQAGIPTAGAVLGVILLAAAIVVLMRGFPDHPVRAIGLGWFALTWVLTSNLVVPIGTIFAERLLYLPLVGFCLVISTLLLRLDRFRSTGILPATACALVILPLLSWGFVRRAAQWVDDETLFAATVETSPRCARAHANLGFVRLQAGEVDAAVDSYTKALSIAPGMRGLGLSLTRLLVSRGRLPEACDVARSIAARFPADPEVQETLASTLEEDGRVDEAEGAWRAALRSAEVPRPESVLGLAALLIRTGREEEALSIAGDVREPDEERPVLAEVRFEAGLAALDRGDRGRFRALMEAAVEANPFHGPAHFNLALQALQEGDRETARRHADAARKAGYQLPPGFLEALQVPP